MAADTNHVVLIGRLTRDAEERQAGETTIRSLRLAVTSRRKVQGAWEDQPNYFDVTVFGNDGIAGYLTKGKQVAITGRLSWREWKTKAGDKRQSVEVIAENIQLLGGREGGGAPVNDDLGEFKKQMGATESDPDSDIPFAASWV